MYDRLIPDGPKVGDRETDPDGSVYEFQVLPWTLRQYYMHESEAGPGPGWDSHFRACEKYGVDEPQDLPDNPLYDWAYIGLEVKLKDTQ